MNSQDTKPRPFSTETRAAMLAAVRMGENTAPSQAFVVIAVSATGAVGFQTNIRPQDMRHFLDYAAAVADGEPLEERLYARSDKVGQQ